MSRVALLVPPAIQDGFVAATNAVRGPTMTLGEAVNPIGSFTDPEYAQVGLTEAARAAHDVVASTIHFDATTRHHRRANVRLCKLIVDRATHDSRLSRRRRTGGRDHAGRGDRHHRRNARRRAAHVPLSFPTYAGILGRVAASVTRQLNRQDFGNRTENDSINIGRERMTTPQSPHVQPGPRRPQAHARQTPQHLLDLELSVGNEPRSHRVGQSVFLDDRSSPGRVAGFEASEWDR